MMEEVDPLKVIITEKEFKGHTHGYSNLKKRRRTGRKQHFCRPVNSQYDASQFAEIILKLERLKNLDWREATKSGQYVIRATCMGKVYGHFVSGLADMAAYVILSRPTQTQNPKEGCPDIDISETIVFHMLYKEMVDNPVVLTLLDARLNCKMAKTDEDFSQLQPLGYMCLDLLELVNYEMGFIDEYLEPWIMHDEKKAEKLPWGEPHLYFSTSCTGGLPDINQLHNGNIMSVFIESMYRLPEDVVTLDGRMRKDMGVYVGLPLSEAEPYLFFPAGEIVNETHHRKKQKKIRSQLSRVKLKGNPTKPSVAYWASVLEHSPEIPKHTTAIPGDFADENESTNLQGDMVTSSPDEKWKNCVDSAELQAAWNCLHKIYIETEPYQKMLQDLSQNSTWPLEVAITINREIKRISKTNQSSSIVQRTSLDKPAKRTGGSSYNAESQQQPPPPTTAMNSGEEPQFETIIVYHGLALFDVSQLLKPGNASVRFASRLYPFSESLLQTKTSITQSLFLSSIPGYNHDTRDSLKAISDTPVSFQQQKQSIDNKKTNSLGPSVANKSRVDNSRKSSQVDIEIKGVPSDTAAFARGDSRAAIDIDTLPFIVFEIRLDHPIVPFYKKDDIHNKVKEYIPERALPRRKVMNAGIAQSNYRQSILRASAQICEQFHANYLQEVLSDPKNNEALDTENAASSCDALQKGFLNYLNATGRYLILREHLRQSISHVIQQKCLNVRPSGFQSKQDFQIYLHDMYIYLVDEMHDVLHKSQLQEFNPFAPSTDTSEQKALPPEGEIIEEEPAVKSKIRNLSIFADEALAQGDFENCHRLHLQRICRSGESPDTWVDFAAMWLGRGDDRMAEIAVREALRKDPEHVYALIVAGLISARHRDERAVDFIGSALGVLPTSPEIMVILAMVYDTLKNNVGSDYYYKNALYLHHVLVGKDTSDIEYEYSRIDESFDILKNTMGTAQLEDLIKQKEQESKTLEDTMDVDKMGGYSSFISKKDNSNATITDPRAVNVRRSTNKSKTDYKNLRVHSLSMPDSEPPMHGKQSIKRDRGSGEHDPNLINGKEIPFTAKRESISGKQNHPLRHLPSSSNVLRPKYQFDEYIPAEALIVSLPPLSRTVETPWDVTEPIILSSHHTKKVVETQIEEEAQNEKEPLENPENKERTSSLEKQFSFNAKQFLEYFNEMIENCSWEEFQKMKSSEEIRDCDGNVCEIGQNNYGEDNANIRQIHSNKHGSEYIWTAQLLLRLRLFDFLDGVLAREILMSEKRTVQYLYLRAISLYLRERSQEALIYVNEATDLDPFNAALWALQGHCYYRLRQPTEAIGSYQKALTLPSENKTLHLVYLRFGALCLDQGGEESNIHLAKKIFLRGAHLYPSPYMWIAYGNTCYELEEYEEAENAFAEANRMDNTSPMIWGYLTLVSLARNNKALAEQSYKWAVRFGLRKGVMMEEIKRIHKEKGFGDPSFPRVPDCLPHEFFLDRVGRHLPFDLYKEALYHEPPKSGKKKFNDTEREAELKRRFDGKEEATVDAVEIKPVQDIPHTSNQDRESIVVDPDTDKEETHSVNAGKKGSKKEKDKKSKPKVAASEAKDLRKKSKEVTKQ